MRPREVKAPKFIATFKKRFMVLIFGFLAVLIVRGWCSEQNGPLQADHVNEAVPPTRVVGNRTAVSLFKREREASLGVGNEKAHDEVLTRSRRLWTAFQSAGGNDSPDAFTDFCDVLEDVCEAVVPLEWNSQFVSECRLGQGPPTDGECDTCAWFAVRADSNKWQSLRDRSVRALEREPTDREVVICGFHGVVGTRLTTLKKHGVSLSQCWNYSRILKCGDKTVVYFGAPYGEAAMMICFDSTTHDVVWVHNVWGVGKGPGIVFGVHPHSVWMRESNTSVAIFAALHRELYIEEVQLETGACRFRFSTKLWDCTTFD